MQRLCGAHRPCVYLLLQCTKYQLNGQTKEYIRAHVSLFIILIIPLNFWTTRGAGAKLSFELKSVSSRHQTGFHPVERLVWCFSLSETSLKLLCNVISSLLIKQVKRIVTNTINRLSEMEYQIKAKQLFSDSAVKLHLAWWLKKIQNHLKLIFNVCPLESDRCQHKHTHTLFAWPCVYNIATGQQCALKQTQRQ